jgi:hypothetical protein
VAQMRSADRVRKCLLFGVDRTYRGHHETDAFEPTADMAEPRPLERTSALRHYPIVTIRAIRSGRSATAALTTKPSAKAST